MILEANIDKTTWKTYGKTKTIRQTESIHLYSHFTLQKHVLKPWTWVFRVGETLIFIKSPFLFFGPMLMIVDWFCIDFGRFVDRCCIDVGCFFDWFGVMAGHEFCIIKLQGCCCCLHCCCFLHRFVRWFWFCQGIWSELSYFVSLKWFANIISRLFHSHTISLTI